MAPDQHLPVMLDEVLAYLDPQGGESYLDLTAGYAGHAAAILARTRGQAVLVDRDQSAIDYLKTNLKDPNVRLIHQDFCQASQKLLGENQQFDLILADLGLSSPHLNTASRGFSFQNEGPLDMRMDPSQELTAADLVNRSSERELADLLSRYGQEPKAAKLAAAIKRNRPIKTTTELASVVAQVVRQTGKVHPATRTFQALRIAVNDELGLIERSLPLWLELLKPGGRLAVISFHSLEDGLVKAFLKEQGGRHYEARLKLLTKHPIRATRAEIVNNPRARSAKLRAAVKIKTKEGMLDAYSGKK